MSETVQKQSFFVEDTVNRFEIVEGVFIEHKELDEGTFQRFQGLTSRITLGSDGVSTEVDMALGQQRHFLFKNLVTGWNLTDSAGKAVKYDFTKLLKLRPHHLNGLLEDIYKSNPVLAGEDSAEGKDSAKS